MHRRLISGFTIALVTAFTASAMLRAAEGTLPDAAQAGDRAAVLALLKQGADVNATQGDAVTALHWAARRGDAEMARTLIVAGANVRATTRSGRLHRAAPGGRARQRRRDCAASQGRR